MHPHRRRKKRPNYGVRTVEVSRGHNGFGFTISGQQPCILSCIVADSPADAAGLRAGDFLISVNGSNVSKLPHDAVVQLIGNSVGVIKMAIAENYFSDSSDEDILNGRSAHGNRQRPKYPHANKSRMQKAGRASNFSSNIIKTANNVAIDHDNLNKDYKPSASVNNVSKDSVLLSKPVLPLSSSAHCVIINSSINNKNDINNVSAMVNPGLEQVRAIKVIRDLRTGAMFEEVADCATTNQIVFLENPSDAKSINKAPTVEGRMEPMDKESSVECRAIVGYLGTIEMPKQIATSSKLQTVRSCIRKMRQEKRTPCTVLMTILPSCMTLRSSSGELLAEYPAKRLNYVSCSSENDYRFLGLVTSASYPVEVNDFEGPDKRNKDSREKGYDIAISNSCHVFMIDTQIVEHQNHIKKADTFKISCTVDPVTGTCLEFPNNSEYIVNVIRIMYSLKPPNGFSAKGNLENISRLSNMGRKSCSPRGSNFVRKVNRPKFLHDSRSKVRVDNAVNVRMQNNEGYRNERANENLPRNLNRQEPEVGHMNGNDFVANSPQPSNHSEITTTSSNSDSGIGFHNDCQNISDRILVVDFPNPAHNNFNVNVPYVNPTFNSREGKVLPLRENNNRPVGVVGLDIDVDGQFLLNTTPVVEGFSGQGRPLNAGDPILLGNLQSQPSLQNIFLSKKVDGDPSHTKRIEKNCIGIDELKNPSTSHGQYLYSLTDVQKHAIKNKLAVRAMPEKYNGNDKSRKGDSGKYLINAKVNTHDHSRLLMPRGLFHQRLAACRDESPHYDPVYSDGLACYEEHHYEIIYPDENNMCNENISNNKKCLNKSSKYNAGEYHQKGSNTEVLYSERTLETVDCEPDYYIGEGDNLNNSSIATCSYDDMSVTSSKSHDCSGKKSNFSVDDVSLYSSKSHDEVAANASKIKAKSYKLQTSVDDILIFGLKNSKSKDKTKSNSDSKKCDDSTVFLHPSNIVKLRVKKNKKSSMFSSKSKNNAGTNNNDQPQEDAKKTCDRKESLLKYKLSPKVFGLPRPSASVEDICKSSTRREMNREVNWGHLEGTTSEPDLRDCRSNHYFRGSGGSPFGRWAGGSGRALQRPHPARRPGSLANSEHDMYTKQCEAEDGASLDDPSDNGPACWAVSLERLLSDPRGVHALSAFLEREFSAENIRFWTACERYARALPAARPALAHAVHARHLAEGAPEPVNVDAHARQLAMERLTAAPPDLFLQAQKQILNLMKFDSYPRFIKSDIHKECLLAELQGRPSPYPGDPALALGPHGSSPSPSKLKKSLSNAEDRRRKSLLPWHRKLRSKSRDRCCEDNEGERRSQADDEEERSEANQERDPHGSNSSLLTGWDVARGLGSKQCGSSCSCDDHKACNNAARGGALCRVLLPHAAATSSVVAVGDGQESVRTLIDKLLRKRALNYLAYEVYLPSSNKPIDIDQTSLVLSGKEVTVEQRVVFKLDLPNRKVISVKSKPNKALGDVLRPILHKYGVGASGGLCVTLGNTMLELTQPVQVADGQRLQVALRSTPVQQADLNKSHTKNAHDKSQSQNSLNQPVAVNGTCGAPSLDEITNRVFEELLQGKADRHSANIEEESVKSDNCSSEHSSGIFGRFLRRDDHRSKGLKMKKTIPTNLQQVQALALANNHSSSEGGSSCCMEDGSCNGPQKPLIAKLRAGVRIQNAVGAPNAMENAEFLENLKQKQRARLKDKMNNPSSQHLVNGQEQKGKENNSNGKIVNQYPIYDEKVTAQVYPSNVLPVAATRITPTFPAGQITKPSPAPRLSLGQGSPNKVISNGSQQSSAPVTKKLETQDSDNYKNNINTEYSPAKSGFNTLDNTVIENNNLDITVSAANQVKGINYPPESANSELKNGNVKYQGNLTQDYLNSSTTSGSDHFMRACDILNSSFHSTSSSCDNEPFRNPPPLPPKPKVLPIKPSNWGHNLTPSEEFPINARMQEVSLPEVGQKEAPDRNKRTVYLDQPSSSFV